MSFADEGSIVILSSPSGAGKTTLVKKLSKLKNYTISVSHTTRPPRTNETNGKDYFFISNKKFKYLIKKKKFLEYAKVFNNYYGSSKDFVIKNLKKEKNVLFDIDWQGTEKIKKQKLKFKLITFFILPPSRKILFKRLSNRDMKDKLIASKRMKQFDKDVLHWKNYDYVVINRNLDKCYKKILNLINSNKYRLNLSLRSKNLRVEKKEFICGLCE